MNQKVRRLEKSMPTTWHILLKKKRKSLLCFFFLRHNTTWHVWAWHAGLGLRKNKIGYGMTRHEVHGGQGMAQAQAQTCIGLPLLARLVGHFYSRSVYIVLKGENFNNWKLLTSIWDLYLVLCEWNIFAALFFSERRLSPDRTT